MIILTVTAGPSANVDTPFSFNNERIVIGRSPVCDLLLYDGAVGQQHCEIRREGTQFVLRDLGSVNGTFVNDQTTRITTRILHHRDEIYLGRSRLLVEISEEGSKYVPLPAHQSEKASQNYQQEKIPSPSQPPHSTSSDNETLFISLLQQQPQVALRIIAGQGVGSVFEAKPGVQRFTVGRSQQADFPVADQGVSRTHFSITITLTSVTLVDEQSLNGTFVNDVKVSRIELHGGEEIRVCDTRLKVDIVFPPKDTPREETNPTKTVVYQQPQEQQSLPQLSTPPVPSSPTHPKIRIPFTFSRTLVMALTALLSTGMVGIFYLVKPVFFASGSLSTTHVALEGECTVCHSPWKSQPISASCGAEDCHASTLKTDAQVQDDCTQCHTEHNGRLAKIKNVKTDAAQKGCWASFCHKEADFLDRPVWRYYKQVFVASSIAGADVLPWALPAQEQARQQWQSSVPQVATGLIFAHEKHVKDSGQEDCLSCHQPLPGTIINILAPISAFPTHEECETCHREVGNRDPQAARAHAAPTCRKCHTREDGSITRTPRSVTSVDFSHNSHKKENCTTCHFTIKGEQTYQPMTQSSLYILPMNACQSCHEQRRATMSCLGCHRTHHQGTPPERLTKSWRSQVTLGYVLLGFLVLESGVCVSLFFRARARYEPQ